MKRTVIKRFLSLVCALVLVFSFSTAAFAADSEDIVLNDGGSPFIKTWDSGEGTDYAYLGYVYISDATTSDYKYLQVTYTGDATAFDQLRLEFLANDEAGSSLSVCWFTENEQGTLKTVDDTLVPAPSATEQTVIIDLEKSGIDLSKGIKAFHVHDTKGTGSFTVTDARLMTSVPAAPSTGDDEPEDVGTGDSHANYAIYAIIALAAITVGATAFYKKTCVER